MIKKVVKDIFLKLLLNILKITICYFFQKERKLKTKKIAANLHDKKEALNQGLILKKVHRVIKFSRKDWREPYIDLNAKPRKKVKNGLEKYLF